ncbi:hypothetical protein MRB53_015663 [Persea americana]|uniref:Uncharacterized protein n=1 Tax=Persea americana TaxID=3435 RepID=A0ACC2M0Z2_PERAE|nr:hypothetical protein MRB53_015663 [Persea americana]
MHNYIRKNNGCDGYDEDVSMDNEDVASLSGLEALNECTDTNEVYNFGTPQPLPLYTQRQRDEWNSIRDNIAKRLWNDCIQSSGGETSSKRKNPRKKNANFIEIISCIEKCNVGLKQAIPDVADSIRMPRKQAADAIWKELRQIPELSGLDMQLAHEWLIIHQNMATIFLTIDDKRAWIVRQMPKIREKSM